MRAVATVVAAGVVLALGGAGIVSAQGPAPTVTLTASTSTTTLPSAGPLAAGPTRFEVLRSGSGDIAISMGALRPGVTLDQFTATLKRNPDDAIEQVYLDGALDLGPRDARKALTFTLRPSATYVVANTSGENPSTWTVTSFTTTGQASGAALPRADASLRMVDLRFSGDTVLPRNGVLRVENRGWAPHFALAFPLRRGANTRAVGRALRNGSDRQLGRLLDFESGTEAQGLVTRGAVNYNEVRFPKRGRHVLVCFFDGHNAQGMYRFVRVR